MEISMFNWIKNLFTPKDKGAEYDFTEAAQGPVLPRYEPAPVEVKVENTPRATPSAKKTRAKPTGAHVEKKPAAKIPAEKKPAAKKNPDKTEPKPNSSSHGRKPHVQKKK
jgi:hypothetical protein